MDKIQLTLHKNYVSEWDIKYAIREIIQNIKDNPSEDIINIKDGVLFLGNKEGALDRKTLLLGNSTKDTNETIGKFGEGYKLALLVLLRLGVKTTIYTGDEIWEPSFEKHRALDEDVLTITIRKNRKKDNAGILYKLENIKEQYTLEELLDSIILSTDRFSQVYEGDKVSIYEADNQDDDGKLFINGMFITQIANFNYSYDFKPEVLNVGRDRNIVDEFDVCYATSQAWSHVKDQKVVLDLMRENKPEIKFIHHWKYRIDKSVIESLALEYANYIPVSYNDEIKTIQDRYDTGKYQFKVVPSFIKDLLPKLNLAPKKKLSREEFQNKYKKYFTKRMLADWNNLR